MAENQNCILMGAGNAGAKDGCYTGISQMAREARMLKTYWENAVLASGGIESTTNSVEKGKLQMADWTMLGITKGLFDTMPERFNEDGTEKESCENITGVKTWGTGCAAIITAYKAAA